MSYTLTAASGSRVSIPVAQDLTGSIVNFIYSISSTFEPKNSSTVTVSQSNGQASFTLPTLNNDVYYVLTATKDDKTQTVADGLVYQPTPPKSGAGVGPDSVDSTSIVDGSIVDADISATAGISPTKIAGTVITGTDSRLSDQRTPIDGSVSTTKIADGAVTNVKVSDVNADKIVDGTNNKVYTATEKTKLAGVASGATANDTDANLKNRANHTGTQAASTITGLANVATTGDYADLINKPTGGSGGSTPPDIQTFVATTGTWTKPANAKVVRVVCIGAGGGGGSGRKGAAGTARFGGAGGGGGGWSERVFVATDLPATVAIDAGIGGGKAPGRVSNSTSGTNGNAGGNSTFGSFVRATGGTGGGGGSTVAGAGGASGAGLLNASSGATSTSSQGAAASNSNGAGAGGGSGAGIPTGNSYAGGGAGGGVNSVDGIGGTGGVDGSSPTGGAGANKSLGTPGAGGGGGASAANGGKGGNYGGGGGGGGAGVDDVADSGSGGDGGAGIVMVITTF